MLAQTLTTPNLSVKWGFSAVGKYWKKPIVGRCNQADLGSIAWSEKAREDKASLNQLVAEAWKAWVQEVD